MSDPVNKPLHYGDGQIECIDYMKDNMDTMMFLGYLEGNTKKYLHRYSIRESLLKTGLSPQAPRRLEMIF